MRRFANLIAMFLMIILAAACGGLVSGHGAGATYADIAYGDASAQQTLDLYVPAGSGPFPVIVYIHGGGFKFGDKRSGTASTIVRAGVERGYAVASINYRLSDEAKFPAAVDDALLAVRFLKAEAGSYGLSAGQIVAWGDSAGGNLAAMVATNRGEADGAGIQAAINWFGPIQFDQMDAQFAALGLEPRLGATSAPGSPESQYLGVTVGTPEAAELVRRASPQSYITPDDPPVFIQHGTADRNVPVLQSEAFAAALSTVIGPENVVYVSLEGAGHGGDAFTGDANLDLVFAFLDERVGH